MTALLALWLKRIPWKVYIAAIGLAALFCLGWAIYRTGYSHAELDVHRAHLQADVDTTVARLDTAVQQVHRAKARADTAKRWTDERRVERQALRDSLEDLIAALPEPVVSLIRKDDKQIQRDSATIAQFVALDSAWRNERFARIDLDSLRVQQVAVGLPRQRSHHAVMFVAGALTGVAALLVYAAVR